MYGDRCRYDHVKALPRRGGATGDSMTVGGATSLGGGATSAEGGANRSVVLTDRQVTVPAARVPPQAPSAPLFSSPHSYVEAIRTGLDQQSVLPDSSQLCPFLVMGQCHYGDRCEYLHGDRCEVCGLHLLHPSDAEQRREHEKLCLSEFEAEMEKAFAFQISQDKVCSICMEVVVQKSVQSERRFGILSSCDHVFCLGCIRKWRHAPFSNDVIKACPECRVPSELVIPSVHWVQDQPQKDQLVALFKTAVSKKPCKFFLEGRGSCPFGDRCLYLHNDPFGRNLGSERVRKQLGPEGNVRFMNNVRLWDFIAERETRSAPAHTDYVTYDDDLTALPDDITALPDDITGNQEVCDLSESLQRLNTSDT